jgi:2-polyprenyl-3-methyl-5-hydroxy-6-metoxy-1,4-benzoquinol methylase
VTERDQCTFCGRPLDRARTELVPVPCNVRRFRHEVFHIWRCPGCRTLHCLERVDLERYYAHYPVARQALLPQVRAAYANLANYLEREGLGRDSALLDYGCGKGLLLRYLRENGYARCAGYDRYSSRAELRDPAVLRPLTYDAIVFQDVLEHVENPREVLLELDGYLRPGGLILVGTPNAERIRPHDLRRFWSEVHPPYHLQIFTAAGLAALGAERGWALVAFRDRGYRDLRHGGWNDKAMTEYQWLTDGTLDAAYEYLPAFKRRRLPFRLRLAQWFGYWYSTKANMTAVFRKNA